MASTEQLKQMRLKIDLQKLVNELDEYLAGIESCENDRMPENETIEPGHPVYSVVNDLPKYYDSDELPRDGGPVDDLRMHWFHLTLYSKPKRKVKKAIEAAQSIKEWAEKELERFESLEEYKKDLLALNDALFDYIDNGDEIKDFERIDPGHPIHNAVCKLQTYFFDERLPGSNNLYPESSKGFAYCPLWTWKFLVTFSRRRDGDSKSLNNARIGRYALELMEWVGSELLKIKKDTDPMPSLPTEDMSEWLRINHGV